MLYDLCAMQVVQHKAHQVGLKNVSKLRVSTGAAKLFDLLRTSGEIKTCLTPAFIYAVGYTMRRDERTEKDVAIQNDKHQGLRDHCNASSIARWITAGF